MLEVGLAPIQDGQTVLVQEEPALDIALPQVFTQPLLSHLRRNRLSHIEASVARIYRAYQADPARGLGMDYQQLVVEFQPLFTWAIASWDFLLSTEGCRFVTRQHEHRWGARSDYRAVTDKDFSRLIHGIFRACVLEFAQSPSAPSLTRWLREQFWPRTVETYRRLDRPADPRQRALTPYSYLRCAPYRFLNDYHQELVYTTIRQLSRPAHDVVEAYF